MKYYTKIIVGFFCLLFVSCHPKDKYCTEASHEGIEFINNSNRNINFHIYWSYPDTIIGTYNPLSDGTDGLAPGEHFTRGAGSRSCWESLLKNGKKEWVFIFDKDSLLAIPWDTIRATNRGLLEKRMIDLDYLNSNNFRIIFED